MEEDLLVPPDLQRPWYYERWFLVIVFILGVPLVSPPFVLWPVWSILILRSPWHNHILVNGLAWAMLVTGAVMAYKNAEGEGGTLFTVASIVPGVMVLVITQVMWTRFRMEHGLVIERPKPPTNSAGYMDDLEDYEEEETETRESRALRRSQRRRDSRSGRSSRR